MNADSGGRDVHWPNPPREPGPWAGGPPVAPPGNTPLPPLPGASGVMANGQASVNPWSTPLPGGLGAPAPYPGPASPVPLVDRAPRWVVAVAALIVLALVGGAGYVVVNGGDQFPSEWDQRVAPIAAWVAQERGLDFAHPVHVNFLTEAEYREATGASAEGEADAGPDDEELAELERSLAEMRALGVVTGEPDLAAAFDDLADSGTLAFYSPDTKQVYVRGTEMTPSLRVTIAHELTHVLQDQHYDLSGLQSDDSSDAGVIRALVEGDADRIESVYEEEELTPEELVEHRQASQSEADDAFESMAETVPPILLAMMQSPYLYGPTFVESLSVGGPSAFDDAFKDVPSEEVLYDPTLFGTAPAERKEVTVEAPEGADAEDPDTFGPITLYLVLATRIDPQAAMKAVDGWGGDQYVSYELDGARCVRAAFATDTDVDSVELVGALGEWVAGSPETASVSSEDGTVTLQSCDPGKDAPMVGEVPGDAIQALPVIRTSFFLGMRQQGATAEQARCFALKASSELTIEQMTAAELDPATTQRVQEMAFSCR